MLACLPTFAAYPKITIIAREKHRMPFPAPFMEFWDMHTNRKILRCPVWALKAYPRVQNGAAKVVAKFRRMLSQAKLTLLTLG
jgi:hypothetical protein